MFILFLLTALVHLSRAASVYLYPPSSPTTDPAAALSRHLGLDAFEPLPVLHHNDPPFLGRDSNAILLTFDAADADAVLPSALPPSFDFAISKSAISSVMPDILGRARQSYASVYDGSEDISSLSTFFATAPRPSFAALDLTRLSDIRRQRGAASPQYIELSTQIRIFVQQALAEPEFWHLALLAYSRSSDSLEKRQQPPQHPLPPPHEPLGSISTCFTSLDACINGTESCSSRGQCVEATKSGRTCFICACGVTRTGEGPHVKTDVWTGQSCERKDISGPFTLLAGTAIVLILVALWSISLLSNIGSDELPSTLLATSVNHKRD